MDTVIIVIFIIIITYLRLCTCLLYRTRALYWTEKERVLANIFHISSCLDFAIYYNMLPNVIQKPNQTHIHIELHILVNFGLEVRILLKELAEIKLRY